MGIYEALFKELDSAAPCTRNFRAPRPKGARRLNLSLMPYAYELDIIHSVTHPSSPNQVPLLLAPTAVYIPLALPVQAATVQRVACLVV